MDEPLALEARLLACHLELLRGGVDPRAELGEIRRVAGRQGYVPIRCQAAVLIELAAARFGEPIRLGRLECIMVQASESGYALLHAEALRVASLYAGGEDRTGRYAADARALVELQGYATCFRTFTL